MQEVLKMSNGDGIVGNAGLPACSTFEQHVRDVEMNSEQCKLLDFFFKSISDEIIAINTHLPLWLLLIHFLRWETHAHRAKLYVIRATLARRKISSDASVFRGEDLAS